MWKNMKKLRIESGKTQEEFGRQFGVKKTTYAGYETGSSDPTTDFWIAVADRYKVSTDYLLGQTDDMHGTKYPAAVSPLEAKYNALDEHSRRVVDAVMDAEADRFAKDLLIPPGHKAGAAERKSDPAVSDRRRCRGRGAGHGAAF